ncbi:TRAP transporter substrate-binding protein [Xylophilus sp. GOD-11R]|uniref:TRAP transporter substrate-binding protein n=1 Tax=Xylophilus sp. GOD-11R TaxID=3089814 RepID=UPI00298C0757|nr:TRAP transporter substrate-binding protein [Xylophilus sp. GOD-11R]WPB58912.1 TRAP transporter substrate-binding protein [Xylophilus sp. GOD-11R]
MNRFLSKIALAFGAAGVLAAGGTQAQTVAKYAYGATEDHPQGVAARKFAELVKAKTGGRITVNTYGSGKLGSDPSLQSQVQGGTLEFMTGPTSNFVGLIKGFALFDLPYLVTNYREADALLDGPQGQALLARLDSVGLVGLGYQENGFRSVTNSKHPINKLEDLAGLKIRVIQNPVFIDTFKALGANPLPLPYTELYGALESRAVDAQENPVGLIDSGKFYEVQKYLSLTGHVYSPFIVVGSKKWFDKLSEADRTAVRQAATEASKFMRELERKEETRLMAALKAKGLQINELPPAELARLRTAVKPVVDKYVAELGVDMGKLQESLK